MEPSDWQRWAYHAHLQYEKHRDAATTGWAAMRDYHATLARGFARDRDRCFGWSWRLRFGTDEPEPWA